MAHEQNTFCPYPWMGLCAETDGELMPCVLSKVRYGERRAFPSPELYQKEMLNVEDLKKLRLDLLNGVKNSHCATCWTAESKGMTSLRHHTGNFFSHDIEWARKVTAPDGSYDGAAEFFDIRPGNKCNLKCRMCYVDNSSAWLSDHEFLSGHKFDPGNRNFNWGEDPQAWENIFAHALKGLESAEKIHFHFVGGEPLMEKNHLKFLNRCVQEGIASRIDLRYSSNITILPDDVLKNWEKFRSLYIGASIDGLGLVNEYIRYPSRWTTIEKHLEILLSMDCAYVWVQPCATIYNIYDMPEIYEWASQKKQNHLGRVIPLDVHSHIVHHDILRISNLPQDAIAKLKDKFAKVSYGGGEAFLRGALEFAQQKPEGANLNEFWEYTHKLDQRRRQNFFEMIPEWSQILKKFS